MSEEMGYKEAREYLQNMRIFFAKTMDPKLTKALLLADEALLSKIAENEGGKDMNISDELMKHLTLALFFKKLTEMPTPALIEYKIDDKGMVSAHTEGREVELDFLTAIILRDRIKKVAKDLGDKYIDTFFDLMKEIITRVDECEEKLEDSDEQKNNRDKESIKKFNDMFKDLGL